MQQTLADVMAPASLQPAKEQLAKMNAAVAASLPIPEFRGECEMTCKDGSSVWTEVNTSAMYNSSDQFIGVLGVVRDISKRKRLEDEIRMLAFHDPLTRLPNRRLLNDRLSQAMASSKRSGCYGALMFLDLDNFKPLNDTHGHEVGDLLLIEVASRLKACVRGMDTVARFGGDEFVVMVRELEVDKTQSSIQAQIIAEKARQALSEPYFLTFSNHGQMTTVEHRCSASIGVVLFINHEATQSDVIKWADTAMYQAKEAGRNTVYIATGKPGITSSPDGNSTNPTTN
jgi:diguanylate cyclase (GGDEF)-like protein